MQHFPGKMSMEKKKKLAQAYYIKASRSQRFKKIKSSFFLFYEHCQAYIFFWSPPFQLEIAITNTSGKFLMPFSDFSLYSPAVMTTKILWN